MRLVLPSRPGARSNSHRSQWNNSHWLEQELDSAKRNAEKNNWEALMRGSQTVVYRALSPVHRDPAFLSITHLLPAAFMGFCILEASRTERRW